MVNDVLAVCIGAVAGDLYVVVDKVTESRTLAVAAANTSACDSVQTSH